MKVTGIMKLKKKPILAVKNLSLTLESEKILESLSFDLEPQESLAIIGPNGAGKSVLLKTILGILKPTKGSYTWRSKIKIGYVPQKIEADRHLPIDAQDLLEAKADIFKIPLSEVQEITKIVGLNDQVLKTPIGHLSGGQFQKALLAFALLGRPEVLVLDEPTASLDQPSEEHIYELIHRLQDLYGLTILITSHDLNLVYRYATKVICLNKNQVCFGSPKEVLTPETLKTIYGQAHSLYHHTHEKT